MTDIVKVLSSGVKVFPLTHAKVIIGLVATQRPKGDGARGEAGLKGDTGLQGIVGNNNIILEKVGEA